MYSNPFVLPANDYIRDISVINGSTEDNTHALARARNIDVETAKEFVLKMNEEMFIDPDVEVLARKSNNDRVEKKIKATKLLDLVVEHSMPMSPSMAIYDNPDVNESILSIATDGNIKRRKIFKKERENAELEGDLVAWNIAENQQQGAKRSNNSLSGAQVSKSTILFGPSAHSSLTSTCRSTSGYGNANNEKFLAGNRHYWSADIVMANIASISNITDRELFKQAMESYKIHYPTSEECLELVIESSKYYWDYEPHLDMIKDYLKGLEPVERAMFMYIGDMYHLSKYNEDLVGDLILSMGKPATEPLDEEMSAKIAPYVKGDMWVLANYVGRNFVKGRKHGELMEDKRDYGLYLGTAKNALDTIERYSLLIRAFWTTPNVPASIAELPTIIRRAVPASDTDSTIFTVQDWVKKYNGKGEVAFDEVSHNIRDSIVYLCSQTIIHVLAMMSTNMGVAKRHLFLLGMKNEYYFPVFMVTNATKHYAAYQGAVEGVIKKTMALELKGVNLKSSTSPAEIVKGCHAMICEIMDRVMDGEGMSMEELMGRIANIERGIIEAVRMGKATFLKRVNVKDAEGYKDGANAPTYKAHLFWNEVFGPSYQKAPEPPYRALKFNADVKNKTAMNEWLGRFKNQDCKKRLLDYLEKSGKGMVKTIIIPESIVQEMGVPDDIMENMDIRKTISNNMNCYYTALTVLDIYFLDKKNTNLISDYY